MIYGQCLRACLIIYLFSNIYYNNKVYNWQSFIEIVTHIFELIYSTFVSELYGLIRRILHVIFPDHILNLP